MNQPHCLHVFDWVTSSHSFLLEFQSCLSISNCLCILQKLPHSKGTYTLSHSSSLEFHNYLSISICSGFSQKRPPLRKWNSTITCRFQTVLVSHRNFHPFESGIPQLPVDSKLSRYLTDTPTPSKVEFDNYLSISNWSGISQKPPPHRKRNSTITCRFQSVQVSHENFHPIEVTFSVYEVRSLVLWYVCIYQYCKFVISHEHPMSISEIVDKSVNRKFVKP